MRHVPADLVHSAGLGLDLGERVPGCGVAAHGVGELDVREAPEIRDGLGRVLAGLLNEGGVDSSRLGQDAAHDGEVRFFYAPLGERRGEGPRHGGVEGKDEHARGAAVEAVNRVNPAIELVSKEAQARPRVARLRRSMHDEAAWLRDDGDEGVSVKELDHERSGLGRGARAGAVAGHGNGAEATLTALNEGYNAPL
jgi:hypothetical protein